MPLLRLILTCLNLNKKIENEITVILKSFDEKGEETTKWNSAESSFLHFEPNFLNFDELSGEFIVYAV